jgi:excisionase family DNA binding protein
VGSEQKLPKINQSILFWRTKMLNFVLPDLPDMTMKQVCAFFTVTPPTVYKLINQGKLKTYTIGASRRFTRKSVMAYRENAV